MQVMRQTLKINDLRSGISQKNGKPWQMQDAECVLLNDDGFVSAVGVLLLPQSMRGDSAPRAGHELCTHRINGTALGSMTMAKTSKCNPPARLAVARHHATGP